MGVQLWAPPIPGPVQGPGQRTRLSPPVGGPVCRPRHVLCYGRRVLRDESPVITIIASLIIEQYRRVSYKESEL